MADKNITELAAASPPFADEGATYFGIEDNGTPKSLTVTQLKTVLQEYSAVLAATTASFTTADETKLDGIEALADVTDTTNVNAAAATVLGTVATGTWNADVIAHEYGGLEADVSAYSGLVKITGGATSAVSVTANGESLITAANYAAMRALLDLEVGTDFDAAGTDNSTDVTLAGSYNYLTIAGQVITLGQVDVTTDITGVVPIANLATGTPTGAKFVRDDGTLAVPAGGGDMGTATYDAAGVSEQLVGLTASQTLTNKTISSPIITAPVLTLSASASPAPTTEGQVLWDSDDDKLCIGDGAGTKTFVDETLVVLNSDISEAEGFLRKTGAGAYEAIKSNLAGSAAPTANEDSGDGYAVGSIWIDTTNHEFYVCEDASLGAANWLATSSGVTNLSTTVTNTTVTVVSSTGTNATVPAATTDDAGVMTADQFDKLAGVETGAEANPTDPEIATAYGNVIVQVSEAEKNAGTETALRTYSPDDIWDMVAAYLEVNEVDIKRYTTSGAVTWSAAQESSAIDPTGLGKLSVYLPSGFTGTTLTFQKQNTADAWKDISNDGALVSVSVTADDWNQMPDDLFPLNDSLRLVSDQTETATGEYDGSA